MENQLNLYKELQKLLNNINDEKTIEMADKQMSIIEDSHFELLKPGANFMIYLPNDHDEAFNVCVLGSDGHYIAHTIEMVYHNALIYWITNVDILYELYQGKMDYIILSAGVAERIMISDRIIHNCYDMTHEGSQLLIDASTVLSCITYIYNQCCIQGLLYEGIDSHNIVNLKRLFCLEGKTQQRQKYKSVYALCPAGIKTGGTELMHQLVYEINLMGGNANIAYYNLKDGAYICPPEFAEYVLGHICKIDDIEDSSDNAVVIPEVKPLEGMKRRKAEQLFWWMSVDNYLTCFDREEDALGVLTEIDKCSTFHLVQSEYARSFLLKNHISDDKILHLSDYINQAYFGDIEENIIKQDIVLYNPKKGKEFVSKLIDNAPEINWKAVQNMTTQEVVQLVRSAKVYIDFGNHPGKDRIPREAAIGGCIVITGKKGSAAFEEDVPIPNKYKFDEEKNTNVEIIETLKFALANYEEEQKLFKNYINVISEEKKEFIEDIRSVFFDRKK